MLLIDTEMKPFHAAAFKPGHKEFIKNMITGAASADIAILIVDVYEGIKEQTKNLPCKSS